MPGPDTTHVEGYELFRRIYRNERLSSEVWHATDASGKPVALKLTARDNDPDGQALRLARFEDEVAAGKVLHENVRRLVAYGSVSTESKVFPDGFDWLAFEWIDGESLAEHLARRSGASNVGLGARELRDLARALANALSALHRASPSWIHRDVKPANVLLPTGDLRRALLADLGIAWRDGGVRRTALSGLSPSGTLLYMAPEQFTDEDIGPAVDQYALALTLWECATGVVPLAPSNRSSDIRLARAKPTSLPELFLQDSGAAPALQSVLQRALASNPSDRWVDMVSFWHAFHAAGIRDHLWDEDISFQRLGDHLRPIVVAKEVTTTAVASKFECRGVWLEQGQHLAAYAGRSAEHSRILSWLRSADTAGYLLIVGPPGQGKSALIARLAEFQGAERGQPRTLSNNVALLHMVKSHRDPTRVLQSLVAQADRLLGRVGADQEYQAERDDLRELLLVRLQELATGDRAVTMLVDALDEIAEDGRTLDWLPATLPSRVKCVLSSRNDHRIITALETRLAKLQVEQLTPFSRADVDAYLTARFGQPAYSLDAVIDVTELVEWTGGTPLVVQAAVGRLESEIVTELLSERPKRISLDSVAGSAEALFMRAYDDVVRLPAPGSGDAPAEANRRQVCAKVLHFLACAFEPLDARSIRALLRLDGVELSGSAVILALRSMRPYLVEQEGRYAPWHRGFSEYIVEQEIGADGAVRCHNCYIEWIKSMGVASHEYGRMYFAEHLRVCWTFAVADGVQSGEVALDAWARELVDLSYVRQLIDRGAVYKHRRDLAELVLTLEAETSHPARPRSTDRENLHAAAVAWLRFFDEEAPSLIRHPELLDQQIANSAYDVVRFVSESRATVSGSLLRLVELAQAHRSITRLERRSASAAAILSMGQVSDEFVVTTHAGGVITSWAVDSGEGVDTHQLECDALVWSHPAGVTAFVFQDADEECLPVVKVLGDTAPEEWPVKDEYVKTGVATADAVFLVGTTRRRFADGHMLPINHVQHSSVYRASRVPPMTAVFGTLGTIKAQAVTADGKMMALLVADNDSSEHVKKHVVVLETKEGAIIAKVDCTASTSWIGFDATGVLLLADSRGIEMVDLLDATAKALIPVEHQGWPPLVLIAHPTLRRVLWIHGEDVRVFDLDSLQEIRRERWSEAPAGVAIFDERHHRLIGRLGNPYFLSNAQKDALGIWKLTPDFWHMADSGDLNTNDGSANKRSTVLCRRGRVRWERCGSSLLLEFLGDSLRRVYTGVEVESLMSVFCVGEERLVLVTAHSVSLLDLEHGTLIAAAQADSCVIVGSVLLEDELRIVLFRQEAGPTSASAAGGGDDGLVAEFLAVGIEVVSLRAPNESRFSIDLSEYGEATEDYRHLVVRIAPHSLKVLSGCFLELPDPYGLDCTFSPGGSFVIAEGNPEDFDVFDALNGEHKFSTAGARLIKCLDDSRFLWCRYDGQLVVTRAPRWEDEVSTLSIGENGFQQFQSQFDVSADEERIVWCNDDAIVISNMVLGSEVARFPIHRWVGRLTFVDQTSFLAEGRNGRVMRFELSEASLE